MTPSATVTTPTTTSLASLRAAWQVSMTTKEHAHAALRNAEIRMQKISSALLPSVDRPSVDVVDRLQATADLPAARAEHVARQLDARIADEAEASARAAVLAAKSEEVNVRRRLVVQRLAKHLLAARVEADALSALQDESPFPDSILWPVLQSRTAHFESQLDAWLGTMRSYKLLDE